ncbi:MAG: cytochrome c biogenesis protein CcsA [Deltaproteobacteria bacterium]|nr:cytochrome c biogenesis protein CcsA [Deltaproteobacteria bacterium]
MGQSTFSSMTFFNVTAAGYFAALFTYLANVVTRRPSWRHLSILLAAGGFLAQAAGLTLRWYESGLVEVAAYERAEGTVLTGMHWFAIFAQHPPWSNLYEIMVFMSYGLVLVLLVCEVKFNIQLVGLFGLTIALTALGLASLTIDPTIKPLVPALQSWWIMIHVISSVVGYSAGTAAAVISLLFLVKDRVSLNRMALGGLATAVGVLFVQGRGLTLFTTGEYRARLMRNMAGEWIGVVRPVAEMGGDMKPFYFASPGVGPLMILGLLVSVAGLAWFWMRRNEEPEVLAGVGRQLYLGAFGLVTAVLGVALYNDLSGAPVMPPAEVAGSLLPAGPWRFHISGNQWDLALFFILWVGMGFVAVTALAPESVRRLLPDARNLDRAAYNAVMVAFLLVAVVLVTGALWAHYAWGRYWGWDPKETGALVIWMVYAIYLHARMTYGWVGRPSAAIAVAGFFVILAGFLGVNLGWFADGLHSYGSG